MDISVKTIEIDARRQGRPDLPGQHPRRHQDHVLRAGQQDRRGRHQGRAGDRHRSAPADETTLQELFNAKFSEALKTVGKQLDFVDLYTKRDEFRDRIIQVIGTDLNGYSLEDAAIDYLEQTPMDQLDPTNILDAQGIRKITELTAIEHVRTNEFHAQRGEGDHAAERRRPRGDPRAGAPPGRRGDQAAARDRDHARPRGSGDRRRSRPRSGSRRSTAQIAHRGAARHPGREQGPRDRRRREEPRARHRDRDRAHREGPHARGRRPRAGDRAATHRQGQGARGREARDRRRGPRAHRGREDRRRAGGEHQAPACGRGGRARRARRSIIRPRPRRRRAGQGHQGGRGRGAGREAQGPRAS